MLEAGKADGKVWVVVRRVCGMLDIDDEGQRQRLDRTPRATTCVMKAVSEDGKIREVFCIDLDSVPMWLATINASRVAPHLRGTLVLFQREAAKVLRDHFLGKPPVAPPPVEPQPTHSHVLQWRLDWPRRRPGGWQPRGPTRRLLSAAEGSSIAQHICRGDIDIAEKAGLAQSRNIRQIIKANLAALEELGPLRTERVRKAIPAGFGTSQREVNAYWLNERQAMYVMPAPPNPSGPGRQVVLGRSPASEHESQLEGPGELRVVVGGGLAPEPRPTGALGGFTGLLGSELPGPRGPPGSPPPLFPLPGHCGGRQSAILA